MTKRHMLAAMAAALAVGAAAQVHQEINLAKGWLFSRDSAQWQGVSVPHDWAISGPFDKKWDLQTVAIEQNGEKQATEKSGRSGSLPWIGKGHYKLNVTAPKGYKHAELLFDGAMSEPNVKVNGQQAGQWAYGYNAFRVDATPYINLDGQQSTITVDLNNVEESSRWYPGGGIYRPVTLVMWGDTRFAPWETFARTTNISGTTATLAVDARVEGKTGPQARTTIELIDQQGHTAAQAAVDGNTTAISTLLTVVGAHLWSPEQPYLYTLKLTRYEDGQMADQQTTRVGLRTVSVTKDKGFQLNGQSRKIKGVCLHHDLGPLGAAVNKAALIRQIKTMKAMGCDAIRTSHNMPSQMQMDLCDSLGMMVMAESFDMWEYPKCKNGYARFFKEWAEKDIENLVRGHRNHPSIVMWSIGNEIPEQWSERGVELAKRLQDVCHRFDPSRPVTQGMDKPDAAIKSGFAQVMDVPGLNYRLPRYQAAIKHLPQGFLLGSETASTVSSRGTYMFPVETLKMKEYANGQCSGYDTECCSWSNLPDDDWQMQDDNDWVVGEFVWTGYDYLGEPTPYDTYWPSRSSYFGICDLAGLPKDRYYLYRSHWNTKEHTVHLLPHWTWPGREGQVTPVYCYTDAPEAELFVNGQSQGRRKKDKASRLDRYRLRWNDVKYQPGEIKVVAYGNDGQPVGEQVVKTAGKPKALSLDVECPDNDNSNTLKADGHDMAFITVGLVDKNGTPCPTATDNVTIEVKGAATFQAACNGDATSLQPFTQPSMKLFAGKAVFLVRATDKPGTATVKVKAAGLTKTVKLTVK